MLDTANGIVHTNSAVEFDVDPLQQRVQPYVVQNTPPLLSLGQLCMSGGFSFLLGSWSAARAYHTTREIYNFVG